ncbi:LptE family protein [Aridibaculum aurantiacum]|uniref:LptE family protein n=1 Tax=Aridibaculum aurantiacum TaxID=2810307 RepID=UPI001F601C4B|nr:LptE family protein [Aridibaculum aurantiacum]
MKIENKFIITKTTKRVAAIQHIIVVMLVALASICFSSCNIYRFTDVGSIPPDVKTVKIGFIENRARYVNPQLSPQLTDRLQQKITNQTRLTRTNNDDAHYLISGFIAEDFISTAGISNQTAATNRLTITVHITFTNTLTNKTEEFDVTRNFDFNANLSRNQAEQGLQDEIMRTLTDEIFNRIFSNW